MTFSSSTTPLTAVDMVKRGYIPAWQVIRLSSGNQWLSRVPLGFRLHLLRLLRQMAFLGVWMPFLAIGQVGDVTLSWQAGAPLSTNSSFVLRGSPTLTGNPTNWPVLAHVSGLTTQTVVRITPGAHFFVAQSSNLWGLSPLSNTASVPPLPTPPSLLIQGAQ